MEGSIETDIAVTNRCIIRHLEDGDAAFVLHLANTPGWLRYIGDRNLKTVSDALTYIQNAYMSSYAANGYGMYMVESKVGNQPIGLCGLVKREEFDKPDLGFALDPAYEGQGYGFETSEAVLSFAKQNLGISSLLAFTTLDNTRSIALLKRLGFVYDRIVEYRGDEVMLFFYNHGGH